MKLHTVLLIGALAVAGLPTGAYAGPGHGPELFPGGPDLALRLEHMADHLDLTDEQRASVKNILEASKPEIEDPRTATRQPRGDPGARPGGPRL